MQKCFTILATCCCLLLYCDAALKLPDFIKKCSVKDPEFDACVLKRGREAIPHMIGGLKKYHVPVLDPMQVMEVRATDAGLDMVGRDIIVKGMRNIVLKGIKFDLEKKQITVEVVVPEAHFTGEYEVKGKLMSLPLVGKGTFEATFYDLYVKYATTYELKKMDDGQVYLVPNNYTVDFEPRDVKARLDNLFNGNKVLADNMNAFINENWRTVMKELGQPTYDALGLIIHTMITRSSRTVPYKDVFDDTE